MRSPKLSLNTFFSYSPCQTSLLLHNIHKIAFSTLRGITPQLASEILCRIGDESTFFAESESRLAAVLGFKSKILDRQYRDTLLEKAEKEIAFIDAHNIKVTCFNDPGYPERLRHCDDAPMILYSLGECDFNSSHVVGIVGTRHATPYGIDFVINLIKGLSEKLDNLIIVSGLAYGIDIAAHRASLHNNVPTVAVLAHGLNTIYPAPHRNTAAEIVKSGGALITDYMSQDRLHKGNFLARNRIVAGLCDCLVVAESAEKGGALVTARIAAAYNRDVAALPGRTSDKYSAGCNKLIASNIATLIGSDNDLIEMMGWTPRATEGDQKELPLELSPEEQSVIDHLRQDGESTVNRMCVTLGIPMHRLMPLLVDMEFNSLILPYPGGKYRLA